MNRKRLIKQIAYSLFVFVVFILTWTYVLAPVSVTDQGELTRIANGVSYTAGMKEKLAAYYFEHQKWPKSKVLAEMNTEVTDQLTADIKKDVQTFMIRPGGVIQIRYTEEALPMGVVIYIRPKEINEDTKSIQWSCDSNSITDDSLPQACHELRTYANDSP